MLSADQFCGPHVAFRQHHCNTSKQKTKTIFTLIKKLFNFLLQNKKQELNLAYVMALHVGLQSLLQNQLINLLE